MLKLHQHVRDKIDNNMYYRIGGYNDYQQDIGAMVREYLKTPGKGVKVYVDHRCCVQASDSVATVVGLQYCLSPTSLSPW